MIADLYCISLQFIFDAIFYGKRIEQSRADSSEFSNLSPLDSLYVSNPFIKAGLNPSNM